LANEAAVTEAGRLEKHITTGFNFACSAVIVSLREKSQHR